MDKRYFSKSVFKEALTCPTRLNYCNNDAYANQNISDEFLEALAEGGFQVGELAKIYYEVPAENDLSGQADDVARRTKELLSAENVTIAEAGFIFGRCFCRVDILRKSGDEIELIEVKAKSWNPDEDKFLSARASQGIPKGAVRSGILDYVYDVAFQKYVVRNALKEMFPGTDFTVKAALMMADKRVVADCPRLNQYFKIGKYNNRTFIEKADGADALKDKAHVLTPFWEVDPICDDIIAGRTPEQKVVLRGMEFVPFIDEMSVRYCEGRQVYEDIKLSTKCFSCPYYKAQGDDDAAKKDGYDECWRKATALSRDPYTEYSARPLLEDLWGGQGVQVKGKILQSGKWFLDQVTLEDITPNKINPQDKPGLAPYRRRWVQIALATGHPERIEDQRNLHDGVYLDIANLKAEMGQWEFPPHMIDFETSAVALPFYENMKPYENVAFQFSHHIIDSNDGGKTYTIRHAGQWINEGTDFPNFEFVRQLKKSVGDKGTIFRYSNHENTILRHIRKQLNDCDYQPDTKELIEFIDSITHSTKGSIGDSAKPKRDMVDLWDVVKRYYHDLLMKGSNSIKAVLPAVLNTSRLLREKYAQPIYGSEIPSMNFTAADAKAWVREENGTVLNPYKLLDGIASFFPEETQEKVRISESEDDEEDKQINNGGAALWAYGLLQFCHQEPEKKSALIKALYRYCELDTLAMVFIWEFLNEKVNN